MSENFLKPPSPSTDVMSDEELEEALENFAAQASSSDVNELLSEFLKKKKKIPIQCDTPINHQLIQYISETMNESNIIGWEEAQRVLDCKVSGRLDSS